MPGATSVYGLASGLNTDDIISKLMEIERAPITRAQTNQMALKAKVAAWQDANTRILALRDKAGLLATASTFQAKTISASDDAILTGSAIYQAQAGNYYLRVNALARVHQQKTDGYADTTTTRVGTGTLSIQVGSGAAKDVTIDDTNNTLAGLRDAINRAGAGVTAAIINDGSGSTPYRLVVTSNTSGTAGEIIITPNLTGGTAPTFSTMQTAQDASITLGEGAGAITVTKGTNEITDLIPGVTLNLKSADPDKTITVTVAENTASVKQTLTDFVTQYNNLIDFINQQFKYDTTANTGGTLFSDSSLQTIQSDVINKVLNPVTGLSQTLVVLSQIGITSEMTSNKLTVDDSQLDESLAAGLTDVGRIFAAVGEATSANITYVSSTDKTKPSGASGYAIQITAVAAQARVTAGVSQTENLAQDEKLTINGKEIQLTADMTSAQVLAKINEYSSQTGVVASRTDINGQGSGDYLTLTSTRYGLAVPISAVSSVSNGGGTPVQNTSGIGKTPVTQTDYDGEAGTGTGQAGADVAGTINGEAATGSGQALTGNSGNANTDGFMILVTGQTLGSYGTITFSKGVGSLLAEYLGFITQPVTGAVNSSKNSLQTKIDDISRDIVDMEKLATAKQERLVMQFTAMEIALSKLQSQGSFLTSQLSQISNGWMS